MQMSFSRWGEYDWCMKYLFLLSPLQCMKYHDKTVLAKSNNEKLLLMSVSLRGGSHSAQRQLFLVFVCLLLLLQYCCSSSYLLPYSFCMIQESLLDLLPCFFRLYFSLRLKLKFFLITTAAVSLRQDCTGITTAQSTTSAQECSLEEQILAR